MSLNTASKVSDVKTVHEYELCRRTSLDGRLHSFDDEPADAYYDGSSYKWYDRGRSHRDGDKPACIYIAYGVRYEEYYVNGRLHRDGGKPAILIIDEDRVTVSFYSDGVFRSDFVNLFRNFLLQVLEELSDEYEFSQAKQSGFLTDSQLLSIVQSLTGIIYSYAVEDRYAPAWEDD